MDIQEPRVGVYICHCGQNIAPKVDVEKVVEFAAGLPHVTVARHYKFMCSDPGQDHIIKDVNESGVNRVVVASCSPRMHERTFRNACAKAGLNPYFFQMANIREGSSWVTEDTAWATLKARDLVAAAVARVAGHRALTTRRIGVNKSVLVVGGGIAGMQAALTAAEAGFKVSLVERDTSIGGHMAKFDKTFPTLDCAACIGTPKMVEVSQNPNIKLYTHSLVKDVSGFMGNYKVTILKKPRYVLDGECTGCGECAKVCPVSVTSDWDEGLSQRKAIYRKFPQAVPGTFCIDKLDRAPCTMACPAGVNIQGYVQLISQGKSDEALRIIRERLPLPGVLGRVCPHPCEDKCRRGEVDQAVAIRAIKRYAADTASAIPFPPPKEDRKEKVAIIGSGPAGLAAACFLRQQGFGTTIFESSKHLGGMLRTGIPDYRLPPEILDREIGFILDLGVEVRTEVCFGKDMTLDSLRAEGFSAVFLAIGAQAGAGLGLEGEGCKGIIDAVQFLKDVNLGQKVELGERVAVIGGGNVAIDAARVALRLGAEDVTIIYRRTMEEMPAYKEEIEAAIDEGIKISYLTQPVKLMNGDGCVAGIDCVKTCLGEPDASGRRRPEPVQGSENFIKTDTIITAVGQRVEAPWAGKEPGLAWTSRGTIEVDKDTFQTSIPWVFSAGDAATGPATVVEAVGGARRAAEAIKRFIEDPDHPLLEKKTASVSLEGSWKPFSRHLEPEDRAVPRHITPEAALQDFTEVEKVLDPETARQEAGRCLNCGICSECMECVRACERGAIDHSMQAEEIQEEVGAIILATGFKTYDPTPLGQYGYGRFLEVYTSLQFERLNNATGPTSGNIVTKDGRVPGRVAIIHCVGSRDKKHKAYCSRVCCMYSMKFAHLVREKTGAEVFEYYIDIRSPGKNYEEFYNRVQEEGVHFIRGRVAEITDIPDHPKDQGKLTVVAENSLNRQILRTPVDMVILSTGLTPADGTQELSRMVGVSTDRDGWFNELHVKLAPVSSASTGIYLAGCCQGPKDIPDTVAQASAAAGEALALLSKGWVNTLAETSRIDPDLCAGCMMCVQVCPYSAIEFNQDKRVAEVNDALCQGCGSCSAACPSGAAGVDHFLDRQVFAEIRALLSG